jgi:hypothetical protein
LKKGATPLVACKNKDVVVALREIAAGDVFQAGKGHLYDRIEALPETEPVSALEEGPLTENMDDLSELKMDMSEERVDLSELEMDAIEEAEDVLEPEMDESEEAVEEK